MRITGLERLPGRKRIDVLLDGEKAISLSAEVCLRFGLRVADELTEGALRELRAAETRQGALTSALRLLAYRPRSLTELRARLRQRGYGADLVDETIQRLRRGGLLDDEQFARSWVESRERTSPRSRRLMASELRAKGVEARLAERSVAGSDDEEAAYRAAERRARSEQAASYVRIPAPAGRISSATRLRLRGNQAGGEPPLGREGRRAGKRGRGRRVSGADFGR